MNSRPLRWLFVDLNSFFASCEQQENPALRRKPIGVLPLMAETTCCLAASYEAKAFGVKTGTLVREARARCPGIQFILARHELYTRYHHAIFKAVEQCLPVHAVLSVDEMICELTGSQRDPSTAIALAERVKRTIQTQVGACLTSSIGIAPNRFLAKVASDMQKPDGLTVLSSDQIPKALYRLGLTDLTGIGWGMEERLRQRGIHTVRELCSLSREDMRKIWGGITGERYYEWLCGLEPPLPPTRHGSLGHQHVLEPALRTADGAWQVAKKLLAKAAGRLRKEGSYARHLAVQVKCLEDIAWSDAIRIEETQDTLKLLDALRRIWPPLRREKPFRIAVTLFDLVPSGRHQLSLFEKPQRENLGGAMDAIEAKHGKRALSVGALYQFAHAAPTRIPFNRIPSLDEF